MCQHLSGMVLRSSQLIISINLVTYWNMYFYRPKSTAVSQINRSWLQYYLATSVNGDLWSTSRDTCQDLHFFKDRNFFIDKIKLITFQIIIIIRYIYTNVKSINAATGLVQNSPKPCTNKLTIVRSEVGLEYTKV